jgi:hypothetical protein
MQRWVNSLFNLFASFAIAAITSILIIASILIEDLNPVRLGVILVLLIGLHLLKHPRLFFCRELGLYALFAGYMIVSLLWTNDVVLGTNSVLPTLDCVLIMILVGSLVTYHNLRAVLGGMLAGFLLCSLYYDATSGFPFSRPDDFNYGAIAGMFLFGLYLTLALGWATRRRLVPLVLALILMVHIAATTSIKTNLGVVLGAFASLLIYFKQFMRLVARNAIALVIVAALIVYAIASNKAFIETVGAGLDRVSTGATVLMAKQDDQTRTNRQLGARKNWGTEGIAGWEENPLFGHGVEAFRDDFGVTSHSTPIDLLYNAGLIGLLLFYSVYLSIAWRLHQARKMHLGNLRTLLLATLVCYGFISLSGTMHYSFHQAVFFALSGALLRPRRLPRRRSALPIAAAAT